MILYIFTIKLGIQNSACGFPNVAPLCFINAEVQCNVLKIGILKTIQVKIDISQSCFNTFSLFKRIIKNSIHEFPKHCPLPSVTYAEVHCRRLKTGILRSLRPKVKFHRIFFYGFSLFK